jgi:hypothetical protein
MTLVLAAALFMIFTNAHDSQTMVVGQSDAETGARQPLDTLADHIRNAQQYKFASTENVNSYKVIASGTATTIEYYASNSSTDIVRYELTGTNLTRTADGATDTVMSNVQSLEFRYYKLPSGSTTYNNSALVETSNPNSPSASELPLLAAVRITANVNIDGFTRQLMTTVRLRNSPRKVRI